jgi:hypothetical protein
VSNHYIIRSFFIFSLLFFYQIKAGDLLENIQATITNYPQTIQFTWQSIVASQTGTFHEKLLPDKYHGRSCSEELHNTLSTYIERRNEALEKALSKDIAGHSDISQQVYSVILQCMKICDDIRLFMPLEETINLNFLQQQQTLLRDIYKSFLVPIIENQALELESKKVALNLALFYAHFFGHTFQRLHNTTLGLLHYLSSLHIPAQHQLEIIDYDEWQYWIVYADIFMTEINRWFDHHQPTEAPHIKAYEELRHNLLKERVMILKENNSLFNHYSLTRSKNKWTDLEALKKDFQLYTKRAFTYIFNPEWEKSLALARIKETKETRK